MEMEDEALKVQRFLQVFTIYLLFTVGLFWSLPNSRPLLFINIHILISATLIKMFGNSNKYLKTRSQKERISFFGE